MLAHLQVGTGTGSSMLLVEVLPLPRKLVRGPRKRGKLPGGPTWQVREHF